MYTHLKMQKRRVRKFQLALTGASSTQIAQRLVSDNPLYLGPELVSLEQLVSLIDRVNSRGSSGGGSGGGSTTAAISLPSAADLLLDEDDVEDDENDMVKPVDVAALANKHKPDPTFLANQLKPGDPGFKYDVRKEFKPDPEVSNEWDDDDDLLELDESLDDMDDLEF